VFIKVKTTAGIPPFHTNKYLLQGQSVSDAVYGCVAFIFQSNHIRVRLEADREPTFQGSLLVWSTPGFRGQHSTLNCSNKTHKQSNCTRVRFNRTKPASKSPERSQIKLAYYIFLNCHKYHYKVCDFTAIYLSTNHLLNVKDHNRLKAAHKQDI